MSTKEADRFIERTASDQEFLASIEALGNDADAVFALVQSEGFDCTPEEIKEAFLEAYASQLTAEQLEAVAGGLSTSEWSWHRPWRRSWCCRCWRRCGFSSNRCWRGLRTEQST